MRSRASLSLLVAAVLAAPFACGKKDEPAAAPDPVVACDSTRAASLETELEAVPAADVAVFLDAAGPASDLVARDVDEVLRGLWGEGAPKVERTAPAGGKPRTIWISSNDAARTKIGATAETGYAIKQVDGTLVVYGKTDTDLAHGAYALLEILGARFFHPKQSFVPALGGPRLPKAIDLVRTPAFAARGLQLHTLHPIEWLPALLKPGEQNLADAKVLIDWLVKTGQNHLQWFLLASIPVAEWRPHAEAIIEYAHLRGVTVGAVAQLWGGSSLQSGYSLVTDKAIWQTQLETKLEEILVAPFDLVELGMGEFFASDAEGIVTWLDHGTKYLAEKHPTVTFSVVNHVGNYPNLYSDFRGDKDVFFYHLPKYADPRLMNNVHTVFFFDLYRPFGGYGHDDFFLHRDYIFDQLPKRKIRYFPESAYWASADVDVPLFLPEYVRARWTDVNGLHRDIAAKGLRKLDGHVTFSSGHEWNYWLTDYLTAKMLWEPEKPLEHFLDRYTSLFGDCSPEVSAAFRGFLDLQTKYLFDQKLIPYLSGEDAHDDFGYLSGIVTTPKRVPFEELLKMDEAGLAKVEADIVKPLEELATGIDPHASAIAARCRGADPALRPWCDELRDGMEVVALRARHATATYRAVLAYARKGDANGELAKAKALTDAAAKVIDRRAAGYRWPLESIAFTGKNPTIYPFGYLKQAHAQCFWKRREEQVQWILDTGEGAPFDKVMSCQE